ncbi:MAG TPA: HAD-IB family phosphatase, partial [Gammaproteobacteria bacterium]
MAADDIKFILDFDSTLVRAETLELAVDLVPEGSKVRKRIRDLTDAAMGGRMLFQDTLRERLKLLHMHRDHLQQLGALLREEVTPSFKRNRAFLAANAANIYIVSSGFREVILPVAKSLGLKPENVFANTLRFDAEGFIEGVDWNNPLATESGKVKIVRGLKLDGEVVVVGDGWTDYEVFIAGAAKRFYAFLENVQRPEVMEARGARHAPNFDEVLYDCGLRGAVSYPKNRLKVLLLENIHPEAV